jgi:hypothetical protein
MLVAKSLFEACRRPTVFCGDWPSLASSSSRRFFDQSPQKTVFKKAGWTVAGLPLDYCNILQ